MQNRDFVVKSTKHPVTKTCSWSNRFKSPTNSDLKNKLHPNQRVRYPAKLCLLQPIQLVSALMDWVIIFANSHFLFVFFLSLYLYIPDGTTLNGSSFGKQGVCIPCMWLTRPSAYGHTTRASHVVHLINSFTYWHLFNLIPIGIIVAGTVFLLAQLAVIAIWTYLWQRRRKDRTIDGCSSYGASIQTPTLPGSRTDSLSKLYDYDHALANRHGHNF